MRFLTRRRFSGLPRRLLVIFFILVCLSAVINLMCLTGICDVNSKGSNPVWSSFGDVVVEANKISVNDSLSKIPFHFPSTATTAGIIIVNLFKCHMGPLHNAYTILYNSNSRAKSDIEQWFLCFPNEITLTLSHRVKKKGQICATEQN